MSARGAAVPEGSPGATPADASALLEVNNIEVVYNDVILVLRGLSLRVPKGQIVALLGANGAGKSTTLKAISGLLKTEEGEVTRGSIHFDGARIDGTDPHPIVLRGAPPAGAARSRAAPPRAAARKTAAPSRTWSSAAPSAR